MQTIPQNLIKSPYFSLLSHKIHLLNAVKAELSFTSLRIAHLRSSLSYSSASSYLYHYGQILSFCFLLSSISSNALFASLERSPDSCLNSVHKVARSARSSSVGSSIPTNSSYRFTFFKRGSEYESNSKYPSTTPLLSIMTCPPYESSFQDHKSHSFQ